MNIKRLTKYKIREERTKRKVAQEKRPEFKIKKIKVDNKFNKFYSTMIEKDKQKKEKIEKKRKK